MAAGQRWYGMFATISSRIQAGRKGWAGLEYKGGCWAVRGVFQRLATKKTSPLMRFSSSSIERMGGLGATRSTF